MDNSFPSPTKIETLTYMQLSTQYSGQLSCGRDAAANGCVHVKNWSKKPVEK